MRAGGLASMLRQRDGHSTSAPLATAPAHRQPPPPCSCCRPLARLLCPSIDAPPPAPAPHHLPPTQPALCVAQALGQVESRVGELGRDMEALTAAAGTGASASNGNGRQRYM